MTQSPGKAMTMISIMRTGLKLGRVMQRINRADIGRFCGVITVSAGCLAIPHYDKPWVTWTLLALAGVAALGWVVSVIWLGTPVLPSTSIKDITKAIGAMKESNLKQAAVTTIGGKTDVSRFDTDFEHAVLGIGGDVTVKDLKQRTKETSPDGVEGCNERGPEGNRKQARPRPRSGCHPGNA